jgi:hypothetical protein
MRHRMKKSHAVWSVSPRQSADLSEPWGDRICLDFREHPGWTRDSATKGRGQETRVKLKYAVSICVGRVRQQASGWLLRGAIQLAPRCEFRGVLLADIASAAEREDVFIGLKRALQVIADNDARRFKRLLSLIRWVVVIPQGGGRGQYSHGLHACLLDSEHVLNDRSELVAATIVHETSHARLLRAGIPYIPRLRERIERTCTLDEIDFLQRLPDSDELVDEARRDLEKGWWQAEHTRARLRQRLKSAFHEDSM